MRLFRSVLYPAASCVLTLTFALPAKAQVVDTTVKVDSTVKADSAAKMAGGPTVVNQDQAVRGMTIFTKTCVECHTLSDVTGSDFKLNWHTRPVFELFDVISTTMPDDTPGSMKPEQYADIVAYLLRINGASAGGAVLVATDTAMLKKALIEIKVPSPNIDSVKVDTTGAKVDTLKVDTLKVDTLKMDTLKVDSLKVKIDTTRVDTLGVRRNGSWVVLPGSHYIGIKHLFTAHPAPQF